MRVVVVRVRVSFFMGFLVRGYLLLLSNCRLMVLVRVCSSMCWVFIMCGLWLWLMWIWILVFCSRLCYLLLVFWGWVVRVMMFIFWVWVMVRVGC